MSKQVRITPQCIYGHNVFSVCINSACKKPGIMCENGSKNRQCCGLFHEQCQKIQWGQVEKIFHDNPNTKTPMFDELNDKMDQLFSSIIKKIQAQHYKYKVWVRTYGYSMQMMRLVKLINEGSFNAVTGSCMNPIIMELLSNTNKTMQPIPINDQDIKQFKSQIENSLEAISELYLRRKERQQISSPLGNSFYFDSKITKDFTTINSLFEHTNIKKATLIYRASQQQFSVSAFHKLCDNHSNTITLIETEYGKIIGGYTPLSWNSSAKHWAEDKSMKSFIFSLTMKQKFQLNLSQFAIACNPQKGPIFGCCDICIFNNANKEKSNAEFPISYNNGKYTRGTQTYTAFTGNPKGQFLIKQWQVLKLEFS